MAQKEKTPAGAADNSNSHQSSDLVTPKVVDTHHQHVLQNESTELSDSVLDTQPSVVLVAKRLTNSDASSGRIILPRVAVETNLSFVVAYRHYGMQVRDAYGEAHEFVVKSWANGSESRRVFVLEGVGKFLKQHHVGVGDVVGICAQGDEFVVEVNTEEVKQAASTTGRSSAASTPRAGDVTRFPFGRSLMSANHNILPVDGMHGMQGRSSKCSRSAKCTKGAGHPGFCSGPKAAAHKSVRDVQIAHAMQFCHSENNSSQMDFCHHAHRDMLDEAEHERQAYVDQVFVDEDLVNSEMQQLPDGLHRLVYVPERVKVVKQLTDYDLSSRRIVLPADQASRGFLLAEGVNMYTLAAVDESHGWQFPTFQCWKSVTERCGYFLEDATGMLAARGARAGDYFMIYRDSIHAPPRIMVLDGDTCAVKKPLNGPDAEVDFLSLPILLLPYGDRGDLVVGGASAIKDVKKWHNGKLGGCCKSVCCLLDQDHSGSCVFDVLDIKEERASNKRARECNGGEYESSQTPVYRERRSSRFARGPDPLVSLLQLLE